MLIHNLISRAHHQAWTYPAEEYEPPEPWACGYDGLSHGHSALPADVIEDDSRRLEEGPGDHDHHERELHEHKHVHEHKHEHDHHHFDINGKNADSILGELRENLRGGLRLGKRSRRLNGSGATYQVDVYVEIDQVLCSNAGDPCAGGLPGASVINYVNLIFAGANAIYEVSLCLRIPSLIPICA